jgi:DNA polymerase III alpha subunit
MIKLDCGCQFETTPEGKIILDFDNINLDCPKTYQLFANSLVKGVFQFESHLGKTYAKKVKPENIQHIADALSILRPGCLQSFFGNPPKNLTQHYVDRKNGKEEITTAHPKLTEILKDTFGILVYQEGTIQIAKDIAGFTEEQADDLRKGIGKKSSELIASLKDKFLEGCAKVGLLNKEQSIELFSWIQASQRYLMNKSHGVGYALSSYHSAYCKVHFPLEFFCSYIKYADEKQDPLKERKLLVEDAKNFNIEVRTPSLLNSDYFIHISGKNTISFGIGNIKGTGFSILQKITEGISKAEQYLNKKIKEWTWCDYLFHFSDVIPYQTNTGLIKTGALDFLFKQRQEMLLEYELWNKFTEREKSWIKANSPWQSVLDAFTQCRTDGVKLAKRKLVVDSLIQTLVNPPTSLTDTPDWIAWQEEQLLGISLTCSKVDGCQQSIKATHTCRQISEDKPKYGIVAVEIVRCKEVVTKNGKNPGQKMCFADLSDGTFTLEGLPCFPQQYQEFKSLLQEENTVLIQVNKINNGHSIEKVWQI